MWRFSQRQAAQLLDPYLSQSGYSIAWLRVGDPLMERTDPVAGTLRGYLIETTEAVDPITQVLHVRQGVPFHNRPPVNGRLMEARDVVYTLDSARGVLYPDLRAARAGAFFRVSDISAVDPATVRVAFDAPSSAFVPGVLGDQRNTAIIPEGIREAFGGGNSLQDANPERHIGTGPFIPVSYDPIHRFERNPDYWNKPYPFFDAVEGITGIDRVTEIAGVLGGQFQSIGALTAAEIDLLRDGDVEFTTVPPTCCFGHIGFNVRRPGLNDPRFRQAVSLVLDRPGLGLAITGAETAWRYPGPLPWSFSEAIPQETLAQRPHFRSPTDEDKSNAAALINAAQLGGFEFTLATAQLGGLNNTQLAAEVLLEAISQSLPDVQLNLDLKNVIDLQAQQQTLDFDAYATVISHEADAGLMMNTVFASAGSRQFTGYGTAAMDELIEGALAESEDPDRRLQLLREAQELAIVDMPTMPTHHYAATVATSTAVRDVHHSSSSTTLFRYAWFTA